MGRRTPLVGFLFLLLVTFGHATQTVRHVESHVRSKRFSELSSSLSSATTLADENSTTSSPSLSSSLSLLSADDIDEDDLLFSRTGETEDHLADFNEGIVESLVDLLVSAGFGRDVLSVSHLEGLASQWNGEHRAEDYGDIGSSDDRLDSLVDVLISPYYSSSSSSSGFPMHRDGEDSNDEDGDMLRISELTSYSAYLANGGTMGVTGWREWREAALKKIEVAKASISAKVDAVTDIVTETAGEIREGVSNAIDSAKAWTKEKVDDLRRAAREVLNDAMGSIKNSRYYPMLKNLGFRVKHIMKMFTGGYGDGAKNSSINSSDEIITFWDGLVAACFGLFNGIMAGLGDVFRDAINHPSCDPFANDVRIKFNQLITSAMNVISCVFNPSACQSESKTAAFKVFFRELGQAMKSIGVFVYRCKPLTHILSVTVVMLIIAIAVTLALAATGFGIVVKIAQVVLTLVFSVKFLFASISKFTHHATMCLAHNCDKRSLLGALEAACEIVGVIIGACLLSGIDKLLTANPKMFFQGGFLKGSKTIKWKPEFTAEFKIFTNRLSSLKSRTASTVTKAGEKVRRSFYGAVETAKDIKVRGAKGPKEFASTKGLKTTADDAAGYRPSQGGKDSGFNSLESRTDQSFTKLNGLDGVPKNVRKGLESSQKAFDDAVAVEKAAYTKKNAATREFALAKESGDAAKINRAQRVLDAATRDVRNANAGVKAAMKAHLDQANNIAAYVKSANEAGVKLGKNVKNNAVFDAFEDIAKAQLKYESEAAKQSHFVSEFRALVQAAKRAKANKDAKELARISDEINVFIKKTPEVMRDMQHQVNDYTSALKSSAGSTPDELGSAFITKTSSTDVLNANMKMKRLTDDITKGLDDLLAVSLDNVSSAKLQRGIHQLKQLSGTIKNSEKAALNHMLSTQEAWSRAASEMFKSLTRSQRIASAYTAGQMAINIGKGSLDIVQAESRGNFDIESYPYHFKIDIRTIILSSLPGARDSSKADVKDVYRGFAVTVVITCGMTSVRTVNIPVGNMDIDQTVDIYSDERRDVQMYVLVRAVPGNPDVDPKLVYKRYHGYVRIPFSDVSRNYVPDLGSLRYANGKNNDEIRYWSASAAVDSIISYPVLFIPDPIEQSMRERQMEKSYSSNQDNDSTNVVSIGTLYLRMIARRLPKNDLVQRGDKDDGSATEDDGSDEVAGTVNEEPIAGGGQVKRAEKKMKKKKKSRTLMAKLDVAMRVSKIRIGANEDAITGDDRVALEGVDAQHGGVLDGPAPLKCPEKRYVYDDYGSKVSRPMSLEVSEILLAEDTTLSQKISLGNESRTEIIKTPPPKSLSLVCRATKIPLTSSAERAFKCMTDFDSNIVCSKPGRVVNRDFFLNRGPPSADNNMENSFVKDSPNVAVNPRNKGEIIHSGRYMYHAVWGKGNDMSRFLWFPSKDSVKRGGVQCEIRTETGTTVGAFRTSVFDSRTREAGKDGYITIPIFTSRVLRWPTLISIFGKPRGLVRLQLRTGEIKALRQNRPPTPASLFDDQLKEHLMQKQPRGMQDSNLWPKTAHDAVGSSRGQVLLSAIKSSVFKPSDFIHPAPWMAREGTCPSVFTHRGVSDESAVENTIDAVVDGALRGYEGMEVDVALIKQGSDGRMKLVLFHDQDLDRVLGYAHKLGKFTIQQSHRFLGLQQALDICGFFPTLNEMLLVVKLLGLQADLEVKPPIKSLFEGYNDNIGRMIGEAIRAVDAVDNVVVSGFDPRKLQNINPPGIIKKIRVALGEHNDFGSKAVNFVNDKLEYINWNLVKPSAHILQWSVLTESKAKEYRKKNMPLGLYTIKDLNEPSDSAAHSEELVLNTAKYGLSWVEADDPAFVKEIYAKRAKCIPRVNHVKAEQDRSKIIARALEWHERKVGSLYSENGNKAKNYKYVSPYLDEKWDVHGTTDDDLGIPGLDRTQTEYADENENNPETKKNYKDIEGTA